jgi:Cu+-exporting ATPase
VSLKILQKLITLVFDKTGTITEQKNLQVKYDGNALSIVDKENIAALMSQSSHPLSKAIVAYLNIQELKEIPKF